MIDKDTIMRLMYKLMFANPHQISNAEDAYIEYEIRMSKEERDNIYTCLNTVFQLLNPKCNILNPKCNIFDEDKYAAKETGIKNRILKMLNERY